MKAFVVSIILFLPMFICAQNPQIEDVDTVVPLSGSDAQRYGWITAVFHLLFDENDKP